MTRINRILVAAAVVAIPTMSACGAGGASNPCSSPNERGLQATMSGVETRAHVTSASAFAPKCGAGNDPPGLSAQRVYRSGLGVEDAIKTALRRDGWESTRVPDDSVYLAHVTSGRFTARVELTVNPNDETATSAVLSSRLSTVSTDRSRSSRDGDGDRRCASASHYLDPPASRLGKVEAATPFVTGSVERTATVRLRTEHQPPRPAVRCGGTQPQASSSGHPPHDLDVTSARWH